MADFYPPVFVKTDKVGLVADIRDALTALQHMDGWEARGPKYRKAVRALSAAMEGLGDVADARTAFEEAAKEAGKWVVPR